MSEQPTGIPPTPLIEVTEASFKYAVLAPAQVILNPEWEQMVWDETLRAAHERGVMPVGSVFVTHEGYQRGSGAKSQSGEPFPPEYGNLAFIPDGDIVVLRGEVQIGLAL